MNAPKKRDVMSRGQFFGTALALFVFAVFMSSLFQSAGSDMAPLFIKVIFLSAMLPIFWMRLVDSGKPGALCFLIFVPLVGLALLLHCLICPSANELKTDRVARKAYSIGVGVWMFLVMCIPLYLGALQEPWMAFIVFGTVCSAPLITVSAMRMTDAGKSPWLALLTLVPVINFGFLIWAAMRPSVGGIAQESAVPEPTWSSPNVVSLRN